MYIIFKKRLLTTFVKMNLFQVIVTKLSWYPTVIKYVITDCHNILDDWLLYNLKQIHLDKSCRTTQWSSNNKNSWQDDWLKCDYFPSYIFSFSINDFYLKLYQKDYTLNFMTISHPVYYDNQSSCILWQSVIPYFYDNQSSRILWQSVILYIMTISHPVVYDNQSSCILWQ